MYLNGLIAEKRWQNIDLLFFCKTVWLRWRTRNRPFANPPNVCVIHDGWAKEHRPDPYEKNIYAESAPNWWITRKRPSDSKPGVLKRTLVDSRERWQSLPDVFFCKTFWLRWRTRKNLFQRVGAYIDVRDCSGKEALTQLFAQSDGFKRPSCRCGISPHPYRPQYERRYRDPANQS